MITSLVCLWYTCKGLDAKITNTTLREIYLDPNANKLVNKYANEMRRFLKVVGKKISVFQRENGLLDLFTIYLDQIRLGKRLNNPKEFVSDFINVQIECIKDPVQYPYGKDGERSASYSGLLRSREIRFNRLRNTAVLKKFEASKYFVQLDTKRCGNNEDKLIAARDQGWITPEGVEIPMEDVLTSDFELGHVLPYAATVVILTRDPDFVGQTKTDYQ